MNREVKGLNQDHSLKLKRGKRTKKRGSVDANLKYECGHIFHLATCGIPVPHHILQMFEGLSIPHHGKVPYYDNVSVQRYKIP